MIRIKNITTQVKIDSHRHEKMKQLAKQNNWNIIDEYRIAIDNHIAARNQEIINKNTNLEEYINKRIGKTEDRLAALVARVGMDSSIEVMGLTLLLSKLMKVDRKEIYDILRKEAAQYFSKPYKAQNHNKYGD